MRSLRSQTAAIAWSIAAIVIVDAPAGAAQQAVEAPLRAGRAVSPGAITSAEIERAFEAVTKDPNLSPTRHIKMLRWRETGQPATALPSWATWLLGLFGWIATTSRGLVYVALFLAVAALAVYLVRLLGAKVRVNEDITSMMPTHVRDLDIRPETLPADVGGAARRLWDDGRRRDALALLYRGLLSRLLHVYALPVRESTTEGDCLALAADARFSGHREYPPRLIGLWQRFVYGGEQVATVDVHALCDEFSSALDRAPVTTVSREGAA